MKSKDALRDTFRSSREPDDDVKRTDEVLSSPDQRRQETSNSAEASKREENGSPTRLNAVKKGLLSAYATNTASSGPSSSMEANDHINSSIRNSPRNTSDDDTGTVGEGPVHHTLPGMCELDCMYENFLLIFIKSTNFTILNISVSCFHFISM